MIYRVFACILLGLWVASCSHSTSTDPSTSDTTHRTDTTHHIDTTHHTGAVFQISGYVEEINTGASVFDTISKDGCYDALVTLVRLDSAWSDSTRTHTNGSYRFDSLHAGKYALSISKNGLAPSALYNIDPSDASTGTLYSTLEPFSWLEATIGGITPDLNIAGDLDVAVSLRSKRNDKSPFGTVFLYISTQRAIDPKNPASYDVIYHYEIGNKKDSNIVEQIVPSQIRNMDGHHYDAGAHVFCAAFAEPYDEQDCLGYLDRNGKKVYPYLGPNPSNTVEFDIP